MKNDIIKAQAYSTMACIYPILQCPDFEKPVLL